MSPIAVVKRMNAKELDEWRKSRTRPLDVSPPRREPQVGEPQPIAEARAAAPLGVKDTYESLLGELWANMRRDRDAYQRAANWLRRRVPAAVSYMTDQQLFEHLDEQSRQATTRSLTDRGLMRPRPLDGIY